MTLRPFFVRGENASAQERKKGGERRPMKETRFEFSTRFGPQVRAWLRESGAGLADSVLTSLEEDTLTHLWEKEINPTEEFVRNVAQIAVLIERHNDAVRATEELALVAGPYIKRALAL